MILEVVKRYSSVICVKKIDTISTTIINILKQPKDSRLLSTSGLKDQSSHIHTNRPTDRHPLPVQITDVKEVVWWGGGELGCRGTDWAGGEEGVQTGRRPQD